MDIAKPEQNETTTKSVKDTASFTDTKGRLITVRRLNALQVYRLTKALGASASNPATADMATLACTVCRINTQDIAFPLTEKDVEYLIQQLDFEGIAAAAEALKLLNENDLAEIEAAKN